MFGPHLIIDGSHCDTARLADRLTIERILTEYPRAIGMTRIGGPYMFEYQAPDPAYSGVSGLVVIAESHIAIHTFPALDFFSMDIFSCKNFDHELAIDYIRSALGVKAMDRMLVQRGLSFRGPHHGPQGATDELIAVHSARYAGLSGATTGSIPINDPLIAQPDTGRMIWPAYGVTADMEIARHDNAIVAAGARAGTTVMPANAAAAGDRALPGMVPVQPMQLNPTASTSGVLDRMTTLGGLAWRLGKAMSQWEALARDAQAPVVLALGPGIVASGMRDLVADLIHRGHVSAVLAEGDTLCADWYESLGYRHYLTEDGGDRPQRDAGEWHTARPVLSGIIAERHALTTPSDLTRHVGQALSVIAPRPGISAAAAEHRVPIFTVNGDFGDLELPALDREADCAALARILARPGAGVVAFGTTAAISELLAAIAPQTPIIALGSAPLTNPGITCQLDATIALPMLATGLTQRLPKRPSAPAKPAAHKRDVALARR